MSNETSTTNKPPKPKRSRRFCIITYIPKKDLYRMLSTAPWVQHWAYIEHDRDIKEDGTIKDKHIHLLLYTFEAKTSSAILKRFDYFAELVKGDGLAQNTLVQILSDLTAQFRYLMHLDNPDKARYNFSEISCDNMEYWQKCIRSFGMTDSTNNKGLQMFNDLLNGASILEMIQRYGKEFIYHFPQFQKVLAEYDRENSNNPVRSDYMLSDFFKLVLKNQRIFDESVLNNFWVVFEYIESDVLTKENGLLAWRCINVETKKEIIEVKENERN